MAASLPDAYCQPLLIRSRGSFELVSARRTHDGRLCVVVLPGAMADPRAVLEAFALVEQAHGRVRHPVVPPVSARGEHEGRPFLELDCDAVVDGHDLVRWMADADRKVHYGAADAFIVSLRKALQAAHASPDPRRGGPLCLGRLSPGNLLFSQAGRWFLVGFGHNFPVDKESGAADGAAHFHQAPELSSGGTPSPMGDYVALLLFMRALMPYVDISGPIGRLLRGEILPSDMGLVDCLLWVEQRVIGQLPSLRASMAEAIEVADRIRAYQETALDPAGFAAYVARLVERSEILASRPRATSPGPLTVTLGPNVEWIAGPDGVRQRLGRAQRRIVVALVEQHRAAAAAVLTRADLLEAGWPGEKPIHEAGANRVYVTVNRLRAGGLRDVIERFDDGYRFSPQAILREAD